MARKIEVVGIVLYPEKQPKAFREIETDTFGLFDLIEQAILLKGVVVISSLKYIGDDNGQS